jgi:putative ABC transport system permease protein
MKPIIARDQVALGPARGLQLALSGMSHRMFRSSVTIAILSLAVAFLVHMLAYGLMKASAQRSAWAELEHTRMLEQYIARLTSADIKPVVVRELAGDHSARLGEYRRWAGAQPAEFERARRAASQLDDVARYLDSLPVAAHAVLVGDFTADELFDRLADPARFKAFSRQVGELGVPAPLGSLGALEQLVVSERPVLSGVADAIVAGHARAIAEVNRAFPGRPPAELAAAPPAGFVSVLATAGFSLPRPQLAEVTQFARRIGDLELMNRLILAPDTRGKIARDSGIELGKVSLESVMNHVEGSSRRSDWLAGVLSSAKAPAHLTGERVVDLAHGYVRERELAGATGGATPDDSGGFLGMSERNAWLIMLSFLVCVVGVANAMLMSVTERFTEIATMKCLGAMDGFVMMMFVFEAAIQGLIGGVIGLVLGSLLAVLRGLVEFGTLISGASGAVGPIALGMLLALCVGMLLAGLAAVGPSFIAARLAPMEAMRVE